MRGCSELWVRIEIDMMRKGRLGRGVGVGVGGACTHLLLTLVVLTTDPLFPFETEHHSLVGERAEVSVVFVVLYLVGGALAESMVARRRTVSGISRVEKETRKVGRVFVPASFIVIGLDESRGVSKHGLSSAPRVFPSHAPRVYTSPTWCYLYCKGVPSLFPS